MTANRVISSRDRVDAAGAAVEDPLRENPRRSRVGTAAARARRPRAARSWSRLSRPSWAARAIARSRSVLAGLIPSSDAAASSWPGVGNAWKCPPPSSIAVPCPAAIRALSARVCLIEMRWPITNAVAASYGE